MNLLISIISDTYDKVTMTQQATDNKQKLDLLLQIERIADYLSYFTFSKPTSATTTEKDPRYLHQICYSLDSDALGGGGDQWEGKIRLLRRSIDDASSKISTLSN